jgi:hypothetical protein
MSGLLAIWLLTQTIDGTAWDDFWALSHDLACQCDITQIWFGDEPENDEGRISP